MLRIVSYQVQLDSYPTMTLMTVKRSIARPPWKVYGFDSIARCGQILVTNDTVYEPISLYDL